VLRQRADVEVVGLFTTINSAADRAAMHAVRRGLVERQARAADLPIDFIPLPHPCPNDAYEAAMGRYVEAALARGVECFAFGDLLLADVRRYREASLAGSGIEPLFPIFGSDTAELARTMVDAGVRAHVTCIDPKRLPPGFAGRVFDHALLDDLPPAVDPCGENGEFHTFAFAGPMFREPIAVVVGETVERDGFVFTDLLQATS
jgi:diphthamide synthase (EF-2-diphthine--ammonia ligase)